MPRRKRELMYRNNFWSPQVQPRSGAGMGNSSCGGRRNNGSEDCRRPVPVEPACVNARTASDCGSRRPSVPDRGCECPKPPVPDCDCPCPSRPSVPDCGCCPCPSRPSMPDCDCCPCAPRPCPPDCDCDCPRQPRPCQPDCVVVIERDCDCGCEKPEKDDDCGCKPSKHDPVSGMPLAMAYVPWQDYKDIYPEDESWCNGTIFAQLDLEFVCRRCN